MPRLFVLAARISETGNQTNLWSFFFQIRSIENPNSKKSVLSEAERIQNRLLLLLFFFFIGFFLWRSFRRGCLPLFFLLLNHFRPSRSGFGLSDDRFLFTYRTQIRNC